MSVNILKNAIREYELEITKLRIKNDELTKLLADKNEPKLTDEKLLDLVKKKINFSGFTSFEELKLVCENDYKRWSQMNELKAELGVVIRKHQKILEYEK